MDVVIVTATTLPEPDPDEPALVAALEERGASVRVLAWDDPAADFASADIAVVRSTWNYIQKREAFCDWADRTERLTRLVNPSAVLRHNTDKIYLHELQERGVPVVPTIFVERGQSAEPALESARGAGYGDVVIKPRVSAGSFATRRFALATQWTEAGTFLAELAAERPMMIQPYQPAVETSGERCLVFIDGSFTHCMRKAPRLSGEPFGMLGPLPVEPEEIALAERALAAVPGQLLYARVDVVRRESGGVQLMELELAEPYLVLGAHPAALERLADAIVRNA
jgi:glutathione synthase/RimK-type ligase-like ATP-grasp enzyme